jgi:hypothetical protein
MTIVPVVLDADPDADEDNTERRPIDADKSGVVWVAALPDALVAFIFNIILPNESVIQQHP